MERRKLKILQAISGKEWSGGQQQTLSLLLGLRKRGHDVKLACPAGSLLGEKARAEGIEVFEAPMKREADFHSMYSLYKFIKKERFDVVNVQRPKVHTLAQVASYFADVPVFVVTRRVLFPIKSRISAKVKYQFGVSKIIAVSEGIKRVLTESGIDEGKIVTIYSGTDLERFNPETLDGMRIRKEFDIPDDAQVVGMIANYSDYRGHNYFGEAVPLILKEVPNACFIIAGRDTTSEKLTGQAESLGVARNIRFAGFRSDVPELLSAMDISVNSSLSEGLAGALRESLAMGVPVVATNVGGNPELVKDGINGLLVPPGDPESLASAIVKLLKDRDLREKMGEAGMEYVVKNLTVEAMVDKTEKLYYGLLEKNQAAGIKQ